MKIIAISLSGIGNTILFIPTIEIIKKNFPNAYITVLVLNKGFAEVLENNPYVDEILYFKKELLSKLKTIISLRKRKFDYSITAFPSNRLELNVLAFLIGAKKRITNNYPSGFFRTLRFLQNIRVPARVGLHDVEQNLVLLQPFGIKDVDRHVKPKIYLTNEDKRYAKKFMKKHRINGKDLVIGIHPSSTRKIKWSETRWAKLIDMLQRKYGAKIILLCGPEEKKCIWNIRRLTRNKPVILKNTSLKQTAAVIKYCKLLINRDSALGHIAASVSTPVITLFGPTDPTRIAPYTTKSIVIRANISCQPCYKYPFYETTSKIKCKNMQCMKKIEVDDIVNVIKNGANLYDG